jgi:hypothetical protein
MINENNPIQLDENSVFFDNRNIFYEHVEKQSFKKSIFKNTDHFFDSDNNKITQKYNVLNENTLNISLFIGFGSTYCKNNICNSDIYKKDTNYGKKRLSYFNDSEDYKGNDLSLNNNLLIFKKTYGLENPDELFEKVQEEPFEEVENIENVSEFFKMPSELKYPRYFNYYSLSRLNSNISVFGTIEEIDGTSLTEKSLKGITCEIISNGTDARERSINFSDRITLQELEIDASNRQKYSIESYSDEEYEDIVTGEDTLLKRSFAYVNKVINGQVVTVFDTSDSTSSFIPRLTNKIIFYTEDSNTITPFEDRSIVENRDNQTANSDYNKGDVYPSHGNDRDNSFGSGPDSSAYTGELD